MINDQTRFYITLLETKKRSLWEQIAKLGRWDQTRRTLAAEIQEIEHELEGIHDDANRKH